MKRIMLFLWAFLSISVLALANSGEDALSAEEKQVMQAIHGRLDASAQSNTSSWAKFVSDEMITPLEGQMK